MEKFQKKLRGASSTTIQVSYQQGAKGGKKKKNRVRPETKERIAKGGVGATMGPNDGDFLMEKSKRAGRKPKISFCAV